MLLCMIIELTVSIGRRRVSKKDLALRWIFGNSSCILHITTALGEFWSRNNELWCCCYSAGVHCCVVILSYDASLRLLGCHFTRIWCHGGLHAIMRYNISWGVGGKWSLFFHLSRIRHRGYANNIAFHLNQLMFSLLTLFHLKPLSPLLSCSWFLWALTLCLYYMDVIHMET